MTTFDSGQCSIAILYDIYCLMLLAAVIGMGRPVPLATAPATAPALDPIVTGASLRQSQFLFCHEDLAWCFTWMPKCRFLRAAGLCGSSNCSAAGSVGQRQGNDVSGRIQGRWVE